MRAWLMQALPGAGTHPLVDQALLGWQGSGEGVTLDGRPALVAFRQVWPANWVVGLFLPLEQLQAPNRRYARERRRRGARLRGPDAGRYRAPGARAAPALGGRA